MQILDERPTGLRLNVIDYVGGKGMKESENINISQGFSIEILENIAVKFHSGFWNCREKLYLALKDCI